MAYKVNRRLLAAEARVCSQTSLNGIFGKQNGTGTGFLRVIQLSPDRIIPPLLHVLSPVTVLV